MQHSNWIISIPEIKTRNPRTRVAKPFRHATEATMVQTRLLKPTSIRKLLSRARSQSIRTALLDEIQHGGRTTTTPLHRLTTAQPAERQLIQPKNRKPCFSKLLMQGYMDRIKTLIAQPSWINPRVWGQSQPGNEPHRS